MPTIKSIVDTALRNDYLVPDLQRDFKWGRERIRSLLASVIAGHPIGAIVVVRHLRAVPASQRQTLTRGGAPGKAPTYVLDGQQRLVSLLAGFRGKRESGGKDSDWYRERVNAYFWCLDVGEWARLLAEAPDQDPQEVLLIERAIRAVPSRLGGRERTDKQGRPLTIAAVSESCLKDARSGRRFLLPMWWLLHQGPGRSDASFSFAAFMEKARAAIAPGDDPARFDALEAQLKSVMSYGVPIITVQPCTAVRAAQMFERMNRKGLPLDGSDLVCSQLFIHDPSLREEMREFLQRCSGTRAGVPALRMMFEEDVFRASACAGAPDLAHLDLKADRMLHRVRSPEGVEAIRHGFGLLVKTHQFSAEILSECGVASRGHWPIGTISQALLAGVARNFDRIERHAVGHWKRRLARWWWSEHLRQIPLARRPELPTVLGELEGKIRSNEEMPPVPDFSKAGLRGHMLGARLSGPARPGEPLTALFECLLRSLRLLDFASGKKLDANYLGLDLHHIFPKAWARDRGIGNVDCLANLTLLTPDTNRNLVRATGPEDFFSELLSAAVNAGASFNDAEAELEGILEGHGISRELCASDRFGDFVAHRMDWLDARLRESAR